MNLWKSTNWNLMKLLPYILTSLKKEFSSFSRIRYKIFRFFHHIIHAINWTIKTFASSTWTKDNRLTDWPTDWIFTLNQQVCNKIRMPSSVRLYLFMMLYLIMCFEDKSFCSYSVTLIHLKSFWFNYETQPFYQYKNYCKGGRGASCATLVRQYI